LQSSARGKSCNTGESRLSDTLAVGNFNRAEVEFYCTRQLLKHQRFLQSDVPEGFTQRLPQDLEVRQAIAYQRWGPATERENSYMARIYLKKSPEDDPTTAPLV